MIRPPPCDVLFGKFDEVTLNGLLNNETKLFWKKYTQCIHLLTKGLTTSGHGWEVHDLTRLRSPQTNSILYSYDSLQDVNELEEMDAKMKHHVMGYAGTTYVRETKTIESGVTEGDWAASSAVNVFKIMGVIPQHMYNKESANNMSQPPIHESKGSESESVQSDQGSSSHDDESNDSIDLDSTLPREKSRRLRNKSKESKSKKNKKDNSKAEQKEPQLTTALYDRFNANMPCIALTDANIWNTFNVNGEVWSVKEERPSVTTMIRKLLNHAQLDIRVNDFEKEMLLRSNMVQGNPHLWSKHKHDQPLIHSLDSLDLPDESQLDLDSGAQEWSKVWKGIEIKYWLIMFWYLAMCVEYEQGSGTIPHKSLIILVAYLQSVYRIMDQFAYHDNTLLTKWLKANKAGRFIMQHMKWQKYVNSYYCRIFKNEHETLYKNLVQEFRNVAQTELCDDLLKIIAKEYAKVDQIRHDCPTLQAIVKYLHQTGLSRLCSRFLLTHAKIWLEEAEKPEMKQKLVAWRMPEDWNGEKLVIKKKLVKADTRVTPQLNKFLNQYQMPFGLPDITKKGKKRNTLEDEGNDSQDDEMKPPPRKKQRLSTTSTDSAASVALEPSEVLFVREILGNFLDMVNQEKKSGGDITTYDTINGVIQQFQQKIPTLIEQQEAILAEIEKERKLKELAEQKACDNANANEQDEDQNEHDNDNGNGNENEDGAGDEPPQNDIDMNANEDDNDERDVHGLPVNYRDGDPNCLEASETV